MFFCTFISDVEKNMASWLHGLYSKTVVVMLAMVVLMSLLHDRNSNLILSFIFVYYDLCSEKKYSSHRRIFKSENSQNAVIQYLLKRHRKKCKLANRHVEI